MQPIRSFTKTVNNPNYVRAVKIERTASGILLFVKGSPSEQHWCGQQGVPGAEGFKILRDLPSSAPNIIPPSDASKLHHSDLSALSNPKVKQHCELVEKNSHQWLMKFATSGEIPTLGPVEDPTVCYKATKGWGSIERIGLPENSYVVAYIRPPRQQTCLKMWQLPEGAIRTAQGLSTSSSLMGYRLSSAQDASKRHVPDVTCPSRVQVDPQAAPEFQTTAKKVD